MKKLLIITGGILLGATACLSVQSASAQCLSPVLGGQLVLVNNGPLPLLDPGVDLSPPTPLSFPAGCYARSADYRNYFYVGYPAAPCVSPCIGAIEGRLGI